MSRRGYRHHTESFFYDTAHKHWKQTSAAAANLGLMWERNGLAHRQQEAMLELLAEVHVGSWGWMQLTERTHGL
jgi:hypothetical protein